MRPATLEVLREEYVVQRVREADEHPTTPYQRGADSDAFGGKKTLQVDSNFCRRPLRAIYVLLDGAAGGERVEGKRARAVILVCDEEQGFYGFGVATFADQKLWGFAEAQDGDAQNTHDEDKGARGEPDVAPAFVVGVGAWFGGGVVRRVLAREVGEEGPGKETGNELADTWEAVSKDFEAGVALEI